MKAHRVDLGFYYNNHFFALHADGSVEINDTNEVDLDTLKYLVKESKAFIKYCKSRKYSKRCPEGG